MERPGNSSSRAEKTLVQLVLGVAILPKQNETLKNRGKTILFIEKQSYQFVVSYTYFYFQFFAHCSITEGNEIFISSVECNAHILFQIYGTLNQRNHFSSYT